MPYFGTRVLVPNYSITIKLHGPLDLYDMDFESLKVFVRTSMEQNINITELTNALREKYCDGHDLLWVEVEILENSTQNIYGRTAEKILV